MFDEGTVGRHGLDWTWRTLDPGWEEYRSALRTAASRNAQPAWPTEQGSVLRYRFIVRPEIWARFDAGCLIISTLLLGGIGFWFYRALSRDAFFRSIPGALLDLGLALVALLAAEQILSRILQHGLSIPQVEVDQVSPACGDTLRIAVRHGGPIRLKLLELELHCTETLKQWRKTGSEDPDPEYRQETLRDQQTRPSYEKTLLSETDIRIERGAGIQRLVHAEIPENAVPSGEVESKKKREGWKYSSEWEIRVRAVRRLRPAYQQAFRIVVEPRAS